MKVEEAIEKINETLAKHGFGKPRRNLENVLSFNGAKVKCSIKSEERQYFDLQVESNLVRTTNGGTKIHALNFTCAIVFMGTDISIAEVKEAIDELTRGCSLVEELNLMEMEVAIQP